MDDVTELLGVFSRLAILFIAVIWILLWWIIFKKAGYSYPFLLGILMSIPFINIVMFLIFTFGEWPILSSKNKEIIK